MYPAPAAIDRSRRFNARHTAQALYAKASAGLGSFHEPSRRWWQQRRVAAASKAERAELAALEAGLSLEEVAHFRAGVAAVHSRLLAPNHAVLQVLIVDAAVDWIGVLEWVRNKVLLTAPARVPQL